MGLLLLLTNNIMYKKYDLETATRSTKEVDCEIIVRECISVKMYLLYIDKVIY